MRTDPCTQQATASIDLPDTASCSCTVSDSTTTGSGRALEVVCGSAHGHVMRVDVTQVSHSPDIKLVRPPTTTHTTTHKQAPRHYDADSTNCRLAATLHQARLPDLCATAPSATGDLPVLGITQAVFTNADGAERSYVAIMYGSSTMNELPQQCTDTLIPHCDARVWCALLLLHPVLTMPRCTCCTAWTW